MSLSNGKLALLFGCIDSDKVAPEDGQGERSAGSFLLDKSPLIFGSFDSDKVAPEVGESGFMSTENNHVTQ